MSLLGVSMDLFLAALMIAALVLGARLNGRLKALKQSHEGFARAIVELNDAAVRAERGLAALREATSETHDSLLSRIETARSLAAKLDSQIYTARGLIEQQALAAAREASPSDRSTQAGPSAAEDAPHGVRRLAQRFGLIPGGESRQTSVRPDAAPAARPAATLPPKPSRRPLPEEDELFEPTAPADAPRFSAGPPSAAASRPEPRPVTAPYTPPAATAGDWAAELEAELAAPAPTRGPTPEDFAARIRARKAGR